MIDKVIWSTLVSWAPWIRWRARSEAPGRDDQRQRCLEQMAAQGMPLWTMPPEHCDRCHRELLLGEHAVLMSYREALQLACPLCAPLLSDEGARTIARNAAAQVRPTFSSSEPGTAEDAAGSGLRAGDRQDRSSLAPDGAASVPVIGSPETHGTGGS
jgi:hypothetical protein